MQLLAVPNSRTLAVPQQIRISQTLINSENSLHDRNCPITLQLPFSIKKPSCFDLFHPKVIFKNQKLFLTLHRRYLRGIPLNIGLGKVRLGSYIVKKAKIRYDWDFNLFKILKKVWLRFYIVENAKIRYAKVRLGPSIIEKPKIRYGWDFTLFKMLK